VYSVLEVSLPITDQAKKRGVCSQLLKDCAAEVLQCDGSSHGGAAAAAAAQHAEAAAEEEEEEEEGPPAASLAPDHVRLHPTAMPRQMVLLSNSGPRPLLFCVCCEDSASGGMGMGGGPLSDDVAASLLAHKLLEVRPVRGVVPPGQDVQLHVHLAGDEWSLRSADHEPEVTYRVRVGSEYSGGGESTAPGTAELAFTATCLTHL